MARGKGDGNVSETQTVFTAALADTTVTSVANNRFKTGRITDVEGVNIKPI